MYISLFSKISFCEQTNFIWSSLKKIDHVIMSESRLKHIEDEKYSPRIFQHSLTAGPLTSYQSFFGGTQLFYGHFNTVLFFAILMAADYNNSQPSSLLRSFIIANLQTSNISAAEHGEARSINEP